MLLKCSKFKMKFSVELFEKPIASKADISYSVNRVYGLFIWHFNICVCVCVCVLEPKWQALILYFTHGELSVCGSPDLSRGSWKMTLTASHTLDLMSFVHSATSKLGNLEDVQLYVAFMWVNMFFIQVGEKQRCCESSGESFWTTLYCGHHLKLLQHDRWLNLSVRTKSTTYTCTEVYSRCSLKIRISHKFYS